MSDIVPIDEVVYFDVITSNPSTGAASDADSTPTFAVYEEATDTDIGVGGNLTKRTSLTGNYRGSFTASAANGFEAGKWYAVIASATVNSVAGKAVAMRFRCVLAESVAGAPLSDVGYWRGTQPNTLQSGRVDSYIGAVASGVIAAASFASGALDAVWSTTTRLLTAGTNIALAKGVGVTGFNDLSAADVRTAVGLASANLDTQFSGLASDHDAQDTAIAGVQSDTDNIQTRLPAALVSGRMDSSVGEYQTGLTPLQPTVAGRTLDVTATGEAGVDLDNTAGTLAKGTDLTGFNDLDAAGVRTAVGLASANLDTQLDALPTNAELATALAAADDAVLAAIAALNNLSAADIRTAVGLASANLDTQLDALPTAAENADAVHDEVIDGVRTLRQLTRGFAAALLGKASGMEDFAPVFRNIADTKDVISASTDADGNRTVVTLDLT